MKSEAFRSEKLGTLTGREITACTIADLFDDVSHQLYKDFKRIEGVQETVNACVKQSKELEAIHHKLEESHQMLTDARHMSVARGSGQRGS